MKQEDKQLLLKDLCGRLPYCTKVNVNRRVEVLDSICDDDGYHFNFIGSNKEGVTIEDIKPYLFPLSSMTDEQLRKWIILYNDTTGDNFCNNNAINYFDWLNAHHFDYRGLIEKGLAIDATGLRIYD